MKILKNTLIAATLFCLSNTVLAVPVTYDFDSITTGTYTEADFSAMFADVSFDNTGGDAFRVTSCTLLGDFTCGNAILNSPYNTAGNSTIATFDYLVDSVSITLGDYGTDAENLYLYAYDSQNNLIATDSFANPLTSYSGYTLNVTGANIAYVEYYGVSVSNNSVFWDNISFNAATVAVPETSTLFLFGGSLIGLGFIRRRKFAR